jgi:hypothetical protein
MWRCLSAVVFVAVSVSALAKPTATPQRFLLFSVDFTSPPPLLERDLSGREIGTLCPNHDFRHYDGSEDGLDSVTMQAKLLEKTSKGVRFSWSIVQRRRGKEIVRYVTREFVPWGTRKRLHAIPGYYVEVFYSDVPANALEPI